MATEVAIPLGERGRGEGFYMDIPEHRPMKDLIENVSQLLRHRR
jgi:hypothetical protein